MYTKQFRGLAVAVIAAIAAFPVALAADDKKNGVEPSTSAVSQKQLGILVPELVTAVAAFPSDLQLEVNLWGTGTAEDRGKFGWNIVVEDRSTPEDSVAVAEEPAPESKPPADGGPPGEPPADPPVE